MQEACAAKQRPALGCQDYCLRDSARMSADLPDFFSFRERTDRAAGFSGKNPTHSLPSQNQGETPFVLLALLLLALLLLFTLQKLVVLPAFGDPSHQLLAEYPKNYRKSPFIFLYPPSGLIYC
jgi:hypothetical protein